MLRITEIKLPLDHPEDAIASAILKKLQIPPEELLSYTIFKRSYDARKKARNSACLYCGCRDNTGKATSPTSSKKTLMSW